MGQHSIDGEITALTWLGYNAVVILTNLNEMQVFDPFSLQGKCVLCDGAKFSILFFFFSA